MCPNDSSAHVSAQDCPDPRCPAFWPSSPKSPWTWNSLPGRSSTFLLCAFCPCPVHHPNTPMAETKLPSTPLPQGPCCPRSKRCCAFPIPWLGLPCLCSTGPVFFQSWSSRSGNGSPLSLPPSSTGVSRDPYLPSFLQSSLSNMHQLLFPLLMTFQGPSLPARCSSHCLVTRESLRGSGPWAFLQPPPGLQPCRTPSSPPQRLLSSFPLSFPFVQKASPRSLTPLLSPTHSGLITDQQGMSFERACGLEQPGKTRGGPRQERRAHLPLDARHETEHSKTTPRLFGLLA